MILPYSYCVRGSQDLRKILSQNIRSARASLNLSQMKLAEYANISVPHMLDIEYCKTWVSDRTLNNIARALNMEVYELFVPKEDKINGEDKKSKTDLRRTVELINAKKSQLRKEVGGAMDDLLMEIIKLRDD